MAAQQTTEKEDSDSSLLLLCSNDDRPLASTNDTCQECFKPSDHDPPPQPRSSPPHPRRKSVPTTSPPLLRREVNRCSGCSRKVGLTGFRCRCGELFCGEHRYSDRHDCSYDYKAAGREAISRENPVVRAAKIIRV